MLSGGKGATALLGLAYLALATRALGVHYFGVLILIHAYVVVVRDFSAFKTSQCIVRYGAICLQNKTPEHFQQLFKFTLLLEIGSAAIGALIAIVLLPVIGPSLGLPVETIPLATLYCSIILFDFKSSSIGILRLFNRFDLLAKQSLVSPLIRLIGVSISFMTNAGLETFLVIWFLSGIGYTLVSVRSGWYELKQQGMLNNMSWRLHNLTEPFPDIWRFVWSTNINITLNMTASHMSTLAVGFVLGPVSVGLFRIAQEAANILTKPAQMFTETIYPEMAKIATNPEERNLWHIIVRAGLIGAGAALAVTLVIALFGQTLLALVFGAEFTDAYSVLLLLMLAGTITMATFSLDPALYAIGRPELLMKIKILTSVLHILVTLYLLMLIGLLGAGIAAIVSRTATAVLLISCVRKLLKAH